MNYDRSFKSKMNSDQRQSFEKMILLGCDRYKKKGLAVVEKMPEPSSVKKKMANGVFIEQFHRSKKAQPDFQETSADGRPVILEARTTWEDKIKQPVVNTTQSDYLWIHTELGACTGVCAQARKARVFVPLSIWDNTKVLYGRKYMTEEELKEYEIATFGFIGFLDYAGEI